MNGRMLDQLRKQAERGTIKPEDAILLTLALVQDVGESVKGIEGSIHELKDITEDAKDDREKLREDIGEVKIMLMEQERRIMAEIDMIKSNPVVSVGVWIGGIPPKMRRWFYLGVVLGFFVLVNLWFVSGFRLWLLEDVLHLPEWVIVIFNPP